MKMEKRGIPPVIAVSGRGAWYVPVAFCLLLSAGIFGIDAWAAAVGFSRRRAVRLRARAEP